MDGCLGYGGGGGGGLLTCIFRATSSPYILLFLKHKIVREPKSHIVQKHTFFAPERYTAGNLHTDSLNSA